MFYETLDQCLSHSLRQRDGKRAITLVRKGVVETEISYGELGRDANRMANTLLRLGLQKRERVMLFLNKCLFQVIASLAIQKTGAITVPVNPGFRKGEISYLMKDAQPRLVICGPEQSKVFKEIDSALSPIVIDSESPFQEVDFYRTASDEAVQSEILPDDPALIIYTSGTTGDPKGAILTQKNLAHDAGNIIKIWEIDKDDVLCHALPLFHVHGLCFALYTPLIAGSHIIMLDGFSPGDVIETLSKKNQNFCCTLFMGVPAMYTKLMEYLGKRRLDFGHIRLWTSGSAPLLPEDFERIREVFGKEPVEREGMSETGMNFSNPLRGRRKPGSIGVPLPDLAVRIVDPETLRDVTPPQKGEIWLKGPGVTKGYWHNAEETRNAFVDGWFRTGDLGWVDEDGYYYLTDRIKHIIISGGENISPKEIEAVINEMDQVAESSVVGIPDPQWGEKVVGAVVIHPESNITPDDVQKHCRENLHKWKCPKEVFFLEKLPRNSMGKVLKQDLKAFFKRKTSP
jgi:malonyl-CoA/methylmalonyl-CoA synthetase